MFGTRNICNKRERPNNRASKIKVTATANPKIVEIVCEWSTVAAVTQKLENEIYLSKVLCVVREKKRSETTERRKKTLRFGWERNDETAAAHCRRWHILKFSN